MLDQPHIVDLDILFERTRKDFSGQTLNIDYDDGRPSHRADFSDAADSPRFTSAKLGPFVPFHPIHLPVKIAAVDAGLIRLGMTNNGIALAFKAAVHWQDPDGRSVSLWQCGPYAVHVSSEDRVHLAHEMGKKIGQSNKYVTLSRDGTPLAIRKNIQDPQEFSDRIRSYVEHTLQREVAKALFDGILFIDGALTLSTRDTPPGFFKSLGRIAKRHNSDIVGISKKSHLMVNGRYIESLLDDNILTPGFKRITEFDDEDGDYSGTRILGHVYACRFTPGGPVFRVDVSNQSVRVPESDVLHTLYANSPLTLGYPSALRSAHQHSSFSKPQVAELLAGLAARFGATLHNSGDIMRAILSPFGKGKGS